MQTDQPSRTAWGVATRRAAHQLVDARPLVLDDPRAVPMLGAGLDTSVYRSPFPASALRMYEVDHPATQAWKRRLLAEAAIAVPDTVRFAPVGFECESMPAKLALAGFDSGAPAYFSWLGVTPYLTLEAFRATLRNVASLPASTTLTFEYTIDLSLLSAPEREAVEQLMVRVALIGGPFRLFFTPEEIQEELRRAGFSRVETMTPEALNDRDFRDRADGLQLYGRSAWLVTAWK